MADELEHRRVSKQVREAISDWPTEKRIAMRALILLRGRFIEAGLDLKTVGILGSLLVDAFTIAAIELRDELECVVVTDLAGLSADEACAWMAKRLRDGCSPITARLAELEGSDG